MGTARRRPRRAPFPPERGVDRGPCLPCPQPAGLPSQGCPQSTDRLVEAHLGVARAIASRYRNRGLGLRGPGAGRLPRPGQGGEPLDPDAGHDFLSSPSPRWGEVRRHFRDACWMVRPPRRLQELEARIAVAEVPSSPRQLGSLPTPSQLAAHLGEPPMPLVLEAMAAELFRRFVPGCPPPGHDRVAGRPAGRRRRGARAAMRGPAAARHPWSEGRTRARGTGEILSMRFFEDRTQAEIAEARGRHPSAQVSRTLTRILDDLRAAAGRAARSRPPERVSRSGWSRRTWLRRGSRGRAPTASLAPPWATAAATRRSACCTPHSTAWEREVTPIFA